MATEVLEHLLRANLAAVAAALLILVLRLPVRRTAGARAAYALWAILPLAMAASLLPAKAPVPIIVPLPAELPAAAPWLVEAPQAAAVAGAFALQPAMLLVLLWAVGLAAGAGATLFHHRRLVRSLGRLAPRSDGALQASVADVGPAVLGALSPRIVVPSDFEQRYEPSERELIIAHERTHLRGGDAQANALMVLLQCLCWFNPLIHIAAHFARLDQELACDAAVLARRPGARRMYAQALLKSQLGQSPLALGCAWPARSPHPLKHRLMMMKAARPGPAARLCGAAVVVLAASASAYAAWAARPAEMVARVVADIAALQPAEPALVSGKVVRIKYSGPLSEVRLLDADGQLWKATSRGPSGLALADWARVTPAIAIEGYLPRAGACVRDPCLVRLASAPAAAAPSPAARTARRPPAAPSGAASPAAPEPIELLPGLPEYAGDLAPDPAEPIRIRGAVTRVDWRYPNAVLHLVSFPDGRRWQVASGPPSNLARTGLSPTDLAGSQVLIRGYRPAAKDCDPECRVVGATVLFEDGEDHSLWGMEE
jgi:beta-lactamase regulating signal transducer with metallopeptidase domain